MKVVIKIALMMTIFQFNLMPDLASAEETKKRESCRVCGMWVDEYKHTAAELVFKDGHKEYTCGVACMLREVEDAGGLNSFESVKVHDWVTGELVDAETATYVMGSRVIPDMVPNYIAFARHEEAEAFAAKEGGDVIGFNIAFQDVSPVGTTAPFRIRTAVTPGAGNFSVGMVYGYTQKDKLKIGSNGTAPNQFIGSNKAQPRAPSQFEGHQQAIIANYSPTDDLALFVNIPWLERRTHTFIQSPAGVNDAIGNENGIGDISLEGRYNVWRSTRWDKFASVLLGTSLPTGQFSNKRELNAQGKNLIATGPALQLGKDTATFTGGLLYSQRWKDIWLHASALYTVNPENDDQFAFGDVVSGGLALHYTPNYDLMFGIEIDSSYTWKNEDQGFKIGNSGGTITNLAFVSDWRFMNAFGGNFKLRGSVGLPIYEDLNYVNSVNPLGKPFQQVQLGNGFFANLAIQWTFRDAPDHYQH
jgi:nitrous oxide reductase accessory protein NosL